MKQRILTNRLMDKYAAYLLREEKSAATYEKYLRDIRAFGRFAGGSPVTKELAVAWKKELQRRGYAVRSINSMLASLNSFLAFAGWTDCKVKNLRLQRKVYCAEDRELTRNDYLRLLDASRKSEQLNLILQTICSTGIRVSELRYFTVEAVRRGEITVDCKNKTRTILIPGKLKKLLLHYGKQMHITGGPIFRGKNGQPLDRSCIWRRMKRLCAEAGVQETKVFPHNLRKLFARTFYGVDKDVVKLADVLGHSSINTTRIYIMTTGMEHRRQIDSLGLVVQAKNKVT